MPKICISKSITSLYCIRFEESDSDSETEDLTLCDRVELLRKIMVERFLSGSDEHVDYQSIDGNEQYDTSKTLSLDKEDAYFDETDDDDNADGSEIIEVPDLEFNPPPLRPKHQK